MSAEQNKALARRCPSAAAGRRVSPRFQEGGQEIGEAGCRHMAYHGVADFAALRSDAFGGFGNLQIVR